MKHYRRMLACSSLRTCQKIALDSGRMWMQPHRQVLWAGKMVQQARTSYACCNVAKRRVAPSGSSWFLSGWWMSARRRNERCNDDHFFRDAATTNHHVPLRRKKSDPRPGRKKKPPRDRPSCCNGEKLTLISSAVAFSSTSRIV
jgi:hypothetical protein